MNTTTNYQLDQRITHKGNVCVITAIDYTTQMIELYNTYTGLLCDVKITDITSEFIGQKEKSYKNFRFDGWV